MYKQFLLAITAVLLMWSSVFSAAWTDTLQGNITTTVTLQNTKRYLMLGTIFVKPGGDLVIPAGTVLFGDKPSKAAIVVERGGLIHANGSAGAPVIFTSSQNIGNKSAGDWGGIILLGKARINTASGADTAVIEGITPAVYFGGQNDADNSGVMRYCRIEYSGIALSPNNEINGLTMGGVGSGTVIEYIQVSWNGDDSFEWFGGTVNCKYLVSYIPVDDELDTDFGFRGKIQFVLAVRKPSVADISGSTCMESDNNNGPNYNSPRTQPHISNVTSIGPKQYDTSVVNPNFTRGAHIRRNTLASFYNSVIMGWPQGILYDGTGVHCAIQNDSSRVKANIFAGCYTGFSAVPTPTGCGFDATAYTTANNTILPTTVAAMLSNPYGNVSTGSYSTGNFYPSAGSPALSGANFTYPGINDPWFTVTTYRGAFDQNSTWANGWTNFRPDSVDYSIIGIEPISNIVPKQYSLQQNYPNPFNPTTNIKFDVAQTGFAKLAVFDVLGREVTTIVSEILRSGQYQVSYNASNLPSGVYFYRLTVTNESTTWSATKKLMLVK